MVKLIKKKVEKVIGKKVPGSIKNRWLALILCIFLGPLGIHRFYVGKVGTGVFYLLTGGFFGIGWVIDILMILFGSFTDKGRNFLI